MTNTNRYALFTVVFVASLGVASIPVLGNVARGMAVMPAVVAMVAALFQLSRDHAAHERTLRLQASQHSFALGATSHMAAVAFDKHVEFSEKYVSETDETFTTLLREGPTEEALSHAAKLSCLRRTYALWLTPTIDAALEKFEAALRRIGASAHFVDVAIDHPGRPAKIDEMFATFAEVMNMPEWEDKPMPAECGTRAVLQKLREILGTEELTHLRESLIKSALSRAIA